MTAELARADIGQKIRRAWDADIKFRIAAVIFGLSSCVLAFQMIRGTSHTPVPSTPPPTTVPQPPGGVAAPVIGPSNAPPLTTPKIAPRAPLGSVEAPPISPNPITPRAP